LGDPTCIANGLPQLLATVSANMATILGEIRGAGFQGVIVVESYYSLDYSGAVATASTQLLNQALSARAPAFGAIGADVFTAFNGRFESIRRRQHLQSEAAEHLDTEPVQLRQ
jgi:hypothetical protein